MYAKAMLFQDTATARKILDAKSSHAMKALGRQVKRFDDNVWCEHRWNIVYTHNKAKFLQNKAILQALIDTQGKTLAEASPYDKIWGIGLDEKAARKMDPSRWPGENLLGEILTALREDLLSEVSTRVKKTCSGQY
jgi:ribA/ribD-fused uncharacterized protein